MNTQDFQFFLRVADLGSISQAAKEANIAVSVASQRVQRLENQLSLKLFYRTTRKLSLTEEAKILIEQGRPLLDSFQTLTENLKLQDQKLSGSINITASATFGTQILVQVIAEFLKQHPELLINLDLNDQNVDLIAQGMDLAIRIGKLQDSSFIAKPLSINKRLLCAAPEYLAKFGIPERLEDLLFSLEDSTQVIGKLSDISKRPIFSMARLDRIKNLTGLAECFGKSKELQEQCNLILVAGKLRVEDSTDTEEINEIKKLYQIIDKYNLQGKVRWLGVMLSKNDSGEIYRIIGDRQGFFVQPALFEAFGLTVLEAMIGGLTTFATRFGGPLEIIEDKVNGFYINPNNHQEMTETILEFLSKCDFNPDNWKEFSQKGIQRVYDNYTWKIHTNRLLSLAKTYSLYNHVSGDKREDMLRYVESLFHLLYKPRAKALLEEHTTSVG